jgi:methyltransferase
MIAVWWILAVVAAQRICELAYAARNTRRLLANGARESGAAHYPLFIALHAAWLVTIGIVAWRMPGVQVNWWLIGLFAVLQCARLWVLATLGPRWTTRIITVPNAPLVTSGPYRFLRHPNYTIVALEIAILPLAFGQYAVAIVFTLLNGALLAFRIRAEERALSATI